MGVPGKNKGKINKKHTASAYPAIVETEDQMIVTVITDSELWNMSSQYYKPVFYGVLVSDKLWRIGSEFILIQYSHAMYVKRVIGCCNNYLCVI